MTFVLLMLLIILNVKYNEPLSPISIIIIIWLCLLILSNTAVSGLSSPSWIGQGIIIIGLFSVVFGACVASPRRPSNLTATDVKVDGLANMLLLILLVVSPLILYAVMIMFKTLMTDGYEAYLRMTRWEGGDKFQIFGGNFLYSIVTVFVRALLYASFFYFTSYYFIKKNRSGFLLALLLFVLYSVVLSSRIEVLVVVISLCSAFFYTRPDAIRYSAKVYFKLLLIIVIGISSLFYFSYYRSGGAINIFEIVNTYIIQYHFLGFNLFDDAVSNSDSIVNNRITYGLATMPILSFIPEQLSSFLPSGRMFSYATIMRDEMQDLVQVNDINGQMLYTNAFYTSFYCFYSDFRIYGVVVYSAVYGYFFSRDYLSWKKYKQPIFLTYTLFWIFTGYSSLFFPPLISEFYWLSLITLYLFEKYSNSTFLSRGIIRG